MNSMIHIGHENESKKDSVLDAAKAVTQVFDSARENIMDQHTVIAALEALAKVAEIKEIVISGSTFTNNDGAPSESAKPVQDENCDMNQEEL